MRSDFSLNNYPSCVNDAGSCHGGSSQICHIVIDEDDKDHMSRSGSLLIVCRESNQLRHTVLSVHDIYLCGVWYSRTLLLY